MGKRYYCEYCARSFPYSADNRKKHINGIQHQREMKLHYDGYRDASAILDEELSKKPCKRYRQQGDCQFGSTCRFSHLTPDDIYYLQQQAKEDKRQKRKRESAVPDIDVDVLNTLITRLSKRSKPDEKTSKEQDRLEEALEVHLWKLPAKIQNYPSLPPSLIPPTIDDILEFGTSSTWG